MAEGSATDLPEFYPGASPAADGLAGPAASSASAVGTAAATDVAEPTPRRAVSRSRSQPRAGGPPTRASTRAKATPLPRGTQRALASLGAVANASGLDPETTARLRAGLLDLIRLTGEEP